MLNKVADELLLPLLADLPEFLRGMEAEADVVIFTQDAFGSDPEEVVLMGAAVKYAGIKGKEIHILPYKYEE